MKELASLVEDDIAEISEAPERDNLTKAPTLYRDETSDVKVADYIAQFLAERGITSVFEMTGGMITLLLDAIYRTGGVRIVSVHHEQSAAFAADAYGRITGLPGVAFATSGPGATNLLTGIGSCHFNSTPAIFITGQVNTYEQKGDRAVRQLGFQETDIVSMARPITKDAVQVSDPERIPEVLAYAFNLATTGRPGPVLIDIPMNIQSSSIKSLRPTLIPVQQNSSFDLTALFAAMEQARQPLLLVGGGIRSGRCIDQLRRFVRSIQIPVVNSLMGVDVLPADDPLRVGMIGSYGNRWANHAIGRSDFLLVLGSRLDVRQTGSETGAFKGDRTIFHVDCEPGEVNNRIVGCHAIIGELEDFLNAALRITTNRVFGRHVAWMEQINSIRRQWPDTKELDGVPGINPNAFMHALSAKAKAASSYVIDVGQHQMWAAQSIDIEAHQRFLTSGGMGSMGFALPAAVGAAIADPGKPVVVVAGDGGFQTNIQELQTVMRNKLPLKIVVINNRCHGMVRQFQQSYFHERYTSTLWGYSAPDFTAVATAYGMAARTAKNPEEVEAALDWLWADPNEPMLLQVMVDTYANAYPKLAFGLPMTEMEPLAKPLGMEST